jgi:HSP20 family protein
MPATSPMTRVNSPASPGRERRCPPRQLRWINVPGEGVRHGGSRVECPLPDAKMETAMADVPVEVKKTAPAEPPVPDAWRSFRSEMDRLFDRFGFPSLRRMLDFEPPGRPLSTFPMATPPIDISEDAKSYKIAAELPGLDAKDVDVTVAGDMLVLKGEKRHEKEQKDKNYHFSERSYGAFRRSFELPASVERDKISADFAKGILTIMLPKNATAQKEAKKIEVKSA